MHDIQQSLRHISPTDFAAFGVNQVAYVRGIRTPQGEAIGIFAADGTQMALAATRDLAFAAIRQHDMEPLSLH